MGRSDLHWTKNSVSDWYVNLGACLLTVKWKIVVPISRVAVGFVWGYSYAWY